MFVSCQEELLLWELKFYLIVYNFKIYVCIYNVQTDIMEYKWISLHGNISHLFDSRFGSDECFILTTLHTFNFQLCLNSEGNFYCQSSCFGLKEHYPLPMVFHLFSHWNGFT